MVKLLKLIKNENKKEMKKISTKIFIGVAIFTIILAVLFVMLMKWLSNMGESTIDSYWKQSVKSEIEYIKENVNQAKLQEDENAVRNLEAQIKFYEFALDNEINIHSMNRDWKIEKLNELITSAATLTLYNIDNPNQINEQNKKINEIFDLIKKDDFKGYIQTQKNLYKELLDNKLIGKDDYNKSIEILEIKEKYEIGKSTNTDDAWKVEVLDEIQRLKQDLEKNIDSYTKKLLTYEQRQAKEDTIKIDLYRLENNIAPIGSYIGETNYRSYFDMMSESFSILVISVLIIMMAGSTIATEYSKGTIKFLTMTPNKRWKILLAKLINILLIMVVLTIVVSLISVVVGNIFFANYKVSPYLFVQNGEVHELNHTMYTVLRFLADDIDIFVYLLFALMLSVITRNTAAAIGVSIATKLGSGMVMTILNAFVKSDWLKFIPFNNFGLTDKIFTNTTTLMTGDITSMMNNAPVVFSLAVLGVCSILMIVTMFDSFNKRDIK